MRFEMDVRRRRCLWAPRLIHCGYYQGGSRKIAFVWIVVKVTEHHVRFLKARDPGRRAARIRALASELTAEMRFLLSAKTTIEQGDIPINSRIRPPCWIINRYYRESMKAASMGALSEIFAVMNRN